MGRLQEISFRRVNRALISAFVERWHPETNTFHMPFGEMTITIHDVTQILGISCVGEPVGLEGGPETPKDLLDSLHS